ncbi:hypothetical protein PC117_g14158 [Phytophthora cactorum]|uniref:Uncharacterized protein n=1 Tax=Phytophthora cactorum TaxID=29920 RepID=A0A8T1CSP2_9STRA|nr:hypothetical protein PC117_g14158 [Phytophthora cactorum]
MPVKESEFGAQLVGEVYDTDPSAEKLDTTTKHIESGKAKPIIATVYPFEKVLDAYAKLKTYHAREIREVHMPFCLHQGAKV